MNLLYLHTHDSGRVLSPFGAKVNYVVCSFNNIKIMLNENNRVARIHKTLKNFYQAVNIRCVKTCGWLVENIHCFAGTSAAELGCKFNTLCFAPGKGCG